MDFDLVTTDPAVSGKLQLARKFTVVRQQQQPFRVEVKPSYRNHARHAGREIVKNRWAILIVAMSRNQSCRFVIEPQPGCFLLRQFFAVQQNFFAAVNIKSRAVNHFAVDRNPLLQNQFLCFPPGTCPGTRHIFCYSFAHFVLSFF